MVGFRVAGAPERVRAIGGILGVYRQVPTTGGPTDGVVQSVASELLEAFRAGEGVDLIRESVRLVMQELIETEPRADRRRPLRAHRVPGHRPQRLPAEAAGHPGRGCAAKDPEAA